MMPSTLPGIYIIITESPKMLSNFGIFWALTTFSSVQARNKLIIVLTTDIVDEVWLFLFGILVNEEKFICLYFSSTTAMSHI